MKRSVLVFCLVITGIIASAQTSKQNAVFNVVKSTKVIAVAPTKMAVLYRGVNNPVEIAISDVPSKYITATVDSGEVVNEGDGNFTIKINKFCRTTKVNVFESYNGVNIKVGEKLFRVKRVPDPVAYIAGTSGGAIDKNVLVAAAGIIPLMRDFDFDLSFIISSFTMTICTSGDLVSYSSTGNKLTPAMIAVISNAPKGTRIYFEDIKAYGPDSVARTLPSIILKLM